MNMAKGSQSGGTRKPGILSKWIGSLAEPKEFNFALVLRITLITLLIYALFDFAAFSLSGQSTIFQAILH